jgi:hypothetical protein
MKEKIMLIAGCSHASGSEIDGEQDSKFNRQHSFGNILAGKTGSTPINMAEPGSTNPTIARSILQWFSEKYDAESMDVFVLVSWTDSSRMEVPWYRKTWFGDHNPFNDYHASTGVDFNRINLGWPGGDAEEKMFIAEYHKFIAKNEKYLEIVSANAVLQLQYFFKSKDIEYLMCNASYMFQPRDTYTNFYLDQIDNTKYYNMEDNEMSFYIKYKNAGYTNPKAKYWHHNETPHALYADELYNFIGETNVFSKMV